jgi:hypothetical protein
MLNYSIPCLAEQVVTQFRSLISYDGELDLLREDL